MSEEQAGTSKTRRKSARIQEAEFPVELASLNRCEEDEDKEDISGRIPQPVVSEEPFPKLRRTSLRIQSVNVPVEIASLNKREESEAKENSSVMSKEPAGTPETRRKSARIQEVEIPVEFISLNRRDETKEGSSGNAVPTSLVDVAQADLKAGRIWTEVIWNDLMSCGYNRETLVTLTRLKDIFTVQLPNMPKAYVTRVVFDNSHRCLVLYRKDKGVIGGICYRPFEERGFIEIVFCAVSSEEQVKGYGKLLMDRLKSYHTKERGIKHFVTYADDFAVGYFRRQGFVNETSNWSLFSGCIKSYSGAQFMGWRATET